jgi:hypothetical protein
MIAASNGYLLAFDNLSGLPAWLSDALCRLVSGGSFAVRQLQAARPLILNGIEEVITRPDLADRSIFLTLPPVAEARRAHTTRQLARIAYHGWLISRSGQQAKQPFGLLCVHQVHRQPCRLQQRGRAHSVTVLKGASTIDVRPIHNDDDHRAALAGRPCPRLQAAILVFNLVPIS